MKRLVALVSLLLAAAASPANACRMGLGPPFPEHVKNERSVFVFQLESLAVTGQGPEYHSAAGRLRVLRVLKGPPLKFRYAQMPIGFCSRHMQVGEPYVMATSQDGTVLDLWTTVPSVLALRYQYHASRPDAENDRGRVLTEIRKILETGKASPGFPRADDEPTSLPVPVPPSPKR